MKKYIYRFLFFLFFLFIRNLNILAQDIHFFQYNSSPQNLNPAQTGLFDGDWRFVGNYRTQWAAIPVPYSTFSFSTDTRFNHLPEKITDKIKGIIPALGLLINTDKSGDSKLKTTQVYISAGIIKKLTRDSTHFISIGIQPGFTNKNFNTAALSFDKQYDGTKYNPGLSSGENYTTQNLNYFDIGAGAAYYWQKTPRKKVNVGFSAYHLTSPNQSFYGDKSIKLDVKTNISGIAEIPITSKIGILPSFLIQRQGKFNETTFGVFGKYYLTPINSVTTTAVSLGAFFRAKDAYVIGANMDYKNFNVGISYDINTSKLANATNKRGAFELSVIYILKKIIPFVAKKRVCPIYM